VIEGGWALRALPISRVAHKGMGAEKCDFDRALQDRAHVSRALFPGPKIGFLTKELPENAVFGDFMLEK
jgi:hypothetical protein